MMCTVHLEAVHKCSVTHVELEKAHAQGKKIQVAVLFEAVFDLPIIPQLGYGLRWAEGVYGSGSVEAAEVDLRTNTYSIQLRRHGWPPGAEDELEKMMTDSGWSVLDRRDWMCGWHRP